MAGVTRKTSQFLITANRLHRNFSSSSTSNARVGFIGLGNMGTPMTLNLMKKGHTAVVYDIFPEAMTTVQGAGAVVAHNPAEVAEKSDIIVTMLPNSSHVMEAFNGENGILQTVKPGSLLFDSSTIDPDVAKQIFALSDKKGCLFMDAPVSGGYLGAVAGTLTFMVGCEEKEFSKAKEFLVDMGRNIVHCGGVGSGLAAKLCNNMLLGITMAGTSEALNLGIRMGLDPKLLSGILNTSTGRCWSSDTYNPVPGVMENVPSANDYKGGFGTALIAKDLGLASASATKTGSSIPLGSLSHQLYRLMSTQGYGGKDFSFIYQFLKEMESK